jgi:hypothetical protein
MPSSAVRTFADSDEYAAAIRAAEVEQTVTGRGRFAAKHVRIDLHRLWMQRFSDNLPRVFHAAHMPGRAMIQFRTEPGPSLSAGGLEMRPTNFLRHSPADTYHERSSGSASCGAMSLPVEDLVTIGEAMAGVDLRPPRDTLLITPPPTAMARLQRLHAAAGYLAETSQNSSPTRTPHGGSSRF